MREENKLIAEFMGMESFKDMLSALNNGKINISTDIYEQAKYHSSWDWLMPVVSEIKTIGSITDRFYEGLDRLDNCIMEVDIELAYQNVVDIIEWYNENK